MSREEARVELEKDPRRSSRAFYSRRTKMKARTKLHGEPGPSAAMGELRRWEQVRPRL